MTHTDMNKIDDILDTVAIEEKEPSYEALGRWCEQYPEHREAITQYFATWAIEKEKASQPVVDEARVASRMVSHAMNLLHQQSTVASPAKSVNSDSRLHKLVKSSGRSEEEIISECQLDESIFAKLDRRLIRYASIPGMCLRKLQVAIRCSFEALCIALDAEPVALGSYKAKGKPVLKVETFLDAVGSSDLDEKLKQEWIEAVKSEPKH